MSERLVVVSNRVAVPRSLRPAPGGLAVGVLEALRQTGGIWVGWNGKVAKGTEGPTVEVQQQDDIEYLTLSMSQADYEDYYLGFANRVLWPLFHLRLNLVQYRRRYLEAYRRFNESLASQVERVLRPDDLLWVHDYHLIPVARNLRKAGCRNRIGFFLHIPFPAFDVFRAIPHHTFILRLFLEYDLIGFQTELDRDSFLDSLQRVFPECVVSPREVVHDGRRISIGVFPIGVDVDTAVEEAAKGRASTQGRRLLANLGERRLIIGVDRLDYSKGLAERFQAYEQFLAHFPRHAEDIVYMQIAQPSRSDVPEYQVIRDEVDYLAGKINGRYAAHDRVPLRYLCRSFSRTTILGFLSLARVGLVTPLRDGMNLVAKEFVAVQDPDDPGVLILSRLAGAAEELEGAVKVTPYNIDGVADAIALAVDMPLGERRERWQQMMQGVRDNTIADWTRSFLAALRQTRAPAAQPVAAGGAADPVPG